MHGWLGLFCRARRFVVNRDAGPGYRQCMDGPIHVRPVAQILVEYRDGYRAIVSLNAAIHLESLGVVRRIYDTTSREPRQMRR
jgi:hypothetical protein